MMKKILVAALLSGFAFLQAKLPSFLEVPTPWADATIATMTFEEKVAQCFMPAVSLDFNEEEIKQAEMFIEKYKVGGIFLGGPGTIKQQINLINRLQKASKVPLLVGQDLECGPAWRLTDGMQWPYHMTLGALDNDELVYRVARAIAEQARALGVHITASPVVDINSNPNNPIINVRSFGATREIVIPKALAMIKGLEEGGVLSCIKHFPGHGDVDLDSHKALPVVQHNQQRMFDVELAPFQAAIDAGASLVMTGHLSVPVFDNSGMPATLSNLLIQNLLKGTMHFNGLVVTDALHMKALPDVSPIEINIRAFDAGNDLLIYPDKIVATIQLIKDFINDHNISQSKRTAIEAAFTARAHKILKAKEWLGLTSKKEIDAEAALHIAKGTKKHHKLAMEMYEHAMTVVRDEQHMVPLKNFENKKVLVVTYGEADAFIKQFSTYKKADHVVALKELKALRQDLGAYDTIIYVYVPPVDMLAGLSQRMFFERTFEPEVVDELNSIRSFNKNLILVLCASPYLLESLPQDLSVLVAYEANDKAQKAAADALCGKNVIQGTLPIIMPDKVDHNNNFLTSVLWTAGLIGAFGVSAKYCAFRHA